MKKLHFFSPVKSPRGLARFFTGFNHQVFFYRVKSPMFMNVAAKRSPDRRIVRHERFSRYCVIPTPSVPISPAPNILNTRTRYVATRFQSCYLCRSQFVTVNSANLTPPEAAVWQSRPRSLGGVSQCAYDAPSVGRHQPRHGCSTGILLRNMKEV